MISAAELRRVDFKADDLMKLESEITAQIAALKPENVGRLRPMMVRDRGKVRAELKRREAMPAR